MAWKVRNVTMTGGTDRVITTHTPVRLVIFYNDSTSTGTYNVGDANMTATVYGFQVAKGGSGPPIGGADILSFNLEEFFVRGTANDIARVSYLT